MQLKQCELTQLNQFLGRNCEVKLKGVNDILISNIFQSFSYMVEDEKYYYILLQDQEKLNNIIRINLQDIIETENYTDEDVYDDCVVIRTKDYTIEISLNESKPEPIICHICGKEILPEDSIYHIIGTPQFGSHFENQDDELQELNFCDDCIHGFVGEVI